MKVVGYKIVLLGFVLERISKFGTLFGYRFLLERIRKTVIKWLNVLLLIIVFFERFKHSPLQVFLGFLGIILKIHLYIVQLLLLKFLTASH